MDNLCHTLVGAALAEAGLKRRTALGTATLMIGANFPDLDVIAVPLDHGLSFRRGITHGIPALIVLPVVLTGIMIVWHRFRGARGSVPLVPSQLLLLSAVSILTHPLLDWMNTYGMRWFMPFSGRWSYIDVLFIVDPWIWLALLVGVLWTRRRERMWERRSAQPGIAPAWVKVPARAMLALVTVYIVVMVVLSRVVRSEVTATLRSRGIEPVVLLASPVPLDPLRRNVVYESDGDYVFAQFDWRASPRLSDDLRRVPRTADDPLALAAAQTDLGREFLSWSRLPFYSFERGPDSAIVYIADARYATGTRGSWASVRVTVPLR